ncbi:hypothetical protein DIPPA_23227 [Diplonema papillatum]|nr:hypothetical protein DIPPA_23227 [Diplonema papillatum]
MVSGSSRLSIISTTSSAKVKDRLTKAFRKGRIEFLLGLLSPAEVACGFAREYDEERLRLFVTGTPPATLVTREQVKASAVQDYPRAEVSRILVFFDTVVVRGRLDTYFSADNTSQSMIEEMLTICGGEPIGHGDKGMVFLFAECTRREHEEFAKRLLSKFSRKGLMINALYTRCIESQSIYLSPDEKRIVSKFCKRLRKKLPSAEDDEAEDDDEACCMIL